MRNYILIILFILSINSAFCQNDTIYDSYYKSLKKELLSDPNVKKIKFKKKIFKDKGHLLLVKNMFAKYRNEKGFWQVGSEIGYDLTNKVIAFKNTTDLKTRTLIDTSYVYFQNGSIAGYQIFEPQSKPITVKTGFNLFSVLFGKYYRRLPSSYKIIEKYANGNDSVIKPYKNSEDKWIELDGEIIYYKPDGTIANKTNYKNGIEVSQNISISKTHECIENSNIYANKFIEYLKVENKDSAEIIIQKWEKTCGLNEPNQRAKILLNLKYKSCTDACVNDSIIFMIMNFQQRLDSKDKDIFKSVKKHFPNLYDSLKSRYFNYIPINKEFDNTLNDLANKLKLQYPENSIEYILCSLYGTDQTNFYEKIQTEKYSKYKLHQKYMDVVKGYADMNFSVMTGLWIPTGSMSSFGNHPEIGVRFGGKYKKYNTDFNIAIRFGDTKEPYFALRPDSSRPESTRQFEGTFLGATFGYDIVQRKYFNLSIIGGAAFEGFEALKGDTIIKQASVYTYNFSFGSEARIYFSRKFYIGIQGQYNIVDYKLTHVINYSSNPFTLRFIIGFQGNDYKRILKYKLYY